MLLMTYQMSPTQEVLFALVAMVLLAIGVFGLNSIFQARRKSEERERPPGPRHILIYEDPECLAEQQESEPVGSLPKH